MGVITFRLPDEEVEVLKEFCETHDRNQTDVLREHIRSLSNKIGGKVHPDTVEVEKLPYIPIERKQELPAVRCVYFVILNDSEIVYIGTTANLKKRWIDHHRFEVCKALNGDIKIAWLEKPARGYLWFEDKAIKRFCPRFNIP